jgi:hypothetical protein
MLVVVSRENQRAHGQYEFACVRELHASVHSVGPNVKAPNKKELDLAGKRYKFCETAAGLELVHSASVEEQVELKRRDVLVEITST